MIMGHSLIRAAIARRSGARVATLAVLALCIGVHGFCAQGAARDPLRIANVQFEDYNGELGVSWDAMPGQELVLRFLVEGFGRLPEVNTDGIREDRIEMQYHIALKDPKGVLIEPEKSGEIKTKIREQDNDWLPRVDWSARVPSYAPPGEYSVEIRATDAIGKKEAAKTSRFRVMGQRVPTADHLEIAMLQFAASEKGPWNPERYFGASETIWFQYKVVGFKTSPKKEYWVEHDWKLIDPEGKEVVSHPKAIEEKETQFYPPEFLGAVSNLKLGGAKEGKYILHVEVRDNIADQSATMDAPFYIRP